MNDARASGNLNASQSSGQSAYVCPQCGKSLQRPIRFCSGCGAPVTPSRDLVEQNGTRALASPSDLPDTEAFPVPSGKLPVNGSGPLPNTSEILIVPGFHTNGLPQTELIPDGTPARMTTAPLAPPRVFKARPSIKWGLVAAAVLGVVVWVGAWGDKQKQPPSKTGAVRPTPENPEIPARPIEQLSENSSPPTEGGTLGKSNSTKETPVDSPSVGTNPTSASPTNRTPSRNDSPEPSGTPTSAPPSGTPGPTGGSPTTSSKPETSPTGNSAPRSEDTPRRPSGTSERPQTARRDPSPSSDRNDTISSRRTGTSNPRPGRDEDDDDDPYDREIRRGSTRTPSDDRTEPTSGRNRRPDTDDDDPVTADRPRGGRRNRDDDLGRGSSGNWSGAATWSGAADKHDQVTVYGFPGTPVSISRPNVRGGQARIVVPPSPSNGWRYAVIEFEKCERNGCDVSIAWRKQ